MQSVFYNAIINKYVPNEKKLTLIRSEYKSKYEFLNHIRTTVCAAVLHPLLVWAGQQFDWWRQRVGAVANSGRFATVRRLLSGRQHHRPLLPTSRSVRTSRFSTRFFYFLLISFEIARWCAWVLPLHSIAKGNMGAFLIVKTSACDFLVGRRQIDFLWIPREQKNN